MGPETLMLSLPIAAAIYTIRNHWRSIRHAWHHARWWEKLILLLALAPIPGPLEEIAGAVVTRRVLARVPR